MFSTINSFEQIPCPSGESCDGKFCKFSHVLVRPRIEPVLLDKEILLKPAKRRKIQTIVLPTATPPILPLDLNSKVSRIQRQKTLEKFFLEYVRILTKNVISSSSELALKHETLLHSSANKNTYVSRAISILKTLKKRTEAEPNVHVDIDEVKKILETVVDELVIYGRLISHTLSLEKLRQMEYPIFAELVNDAAEDKLAAKKCDRCLKECTDFGISQEGSDIKCEFHDGYLSRKTNLVIGNERCWSCCGGTSGFPGCKRGPHVFSIRQLSELHAISPFKKLGDVEREKKQYRVLALDCEMSYTTGGLELTRLTIVDVNGKSVFDTVIRPPNPIIDANTKFSGLTEKDIADAETEFEDVWTILSKFANRDTILIGHGLENDLKSLRICHDRVVDTADLYPHPDGLPKRWSLRVLAERELKNRIQDGTGGHDSFEDALTCIQLVMKVFK